MDRFVLWQAIVNYALTFYDDLLKHLFLCLSPLIVQIAPTETLFISKKNFLRLNLLSFIFTGTFSMVLLQSLNLNIIFHAGICVTGMSEKRESYQILKMMQLYKLMVIIVHHSFILFLCSLLFL